ncbi:bis(5'-adenosyl)-triphosphatase-like isoform X1 [Glandiceps talaboti]
MAMKTYQFGQHIIKASCAFFKSRLTIAFVNIKPVLPGHVLVSPVRVVPRFKDLTAEEITDLFQSTQVIANVIEKHFHSTSLTIAIQDGPEAGQTVEHVHVHILPRKEGDFKKNDDIYEKLEHHDHNSDINKLRTEEMMATEAKQLRNYLPRQYIDNIDCYDS